MTKDADAMTIKDGINSVTVPCFTHSQIAHCTGDPCYHFVVPPHTRIAEPHDHEVVGRHQIDVSALQPGETKAYTIEGHQARIRIRRLPNLTLRVTP